MEEAAQASVRNEIEVIAERVSGDVAIAEASTLHEAIETNQIRIGPSFAGLSPEELELQTIPGGTLTITFEIDEAGGRGELTLLSKSVVEGGVGFGNGQAAAYACWSLPVDLPARTVGEPANAECPAGAVELMGGLEPFEL
ncbi:hypothetical protein GCM10011600_14270 [Pseudolysinimonas yzui]|uniref:Uncharacterized protein n=2 Tax=Pseudolysinimonas yzui TaxID=2708254 RepID=A0A8J3M1M1_9MICO|nr:hypothetical protein GCM10011600_14270 [Pseudolysinimonas yzui]